MKIFNPITKTYTPYTSTEKAIEDERIKLDAKSIHYKINKDGLILINDADESKI